jgi:hypothetical protein
MSDIERSLLEREGMGGAYDEGDLTAPLPGIRTCERIEVESSYFEPSPKGRQSPREVGSPCSHVEHRNGPIRGDQSKNTPNPHP